MKPGSRAALLLLLFLLSPPWSAAVEPISMGIAVGVATTALTGLLSTFPTLYCKFQECCEAQWVQLNLTGLKVDLESKLFGQHIAKQVVLKAIKGFLSNPNPKKPLTLSLHGWTGTGKNLVSQIIAENIYRNGLESGYVHYFVSTLHFPHPENLSHYKQQLQQWIHGNVRRCDRSMFVFSAADKMYPGLINSIEPFLDYYSHLDGVSYRKAIFIFLSNVGGEKIKEIVLNFWERGMKREDIQWKDLENSLLELYDEASGFWHRHLIDKNLIDYFIPFLPLEYKHVVLCAKAELQSRHFKDVEQKTIKVAEEMTYFPNDKMIFSYKGCKTVAFKVDFSAATEKNTID